MSTTDPRLDIWAGMECTVNRVGDEYLDQIVKTGHDRREADLERFAALGIRTLRYPVLWERVAPRLDGPPDWTWCDRRMEQLRRLGMRPVVGLMHHGSGPRDTSLVDPAFPDHFERYATAAVRRYPWAPFWILINEPLTTARFSCLYGHWYPHTRDDRLFAQAIIGQCIAIARASAIIRTVNPQAQIVQSEDLGRAFSTPRLSYQADMENERRWLTFDLLCGRVRRGHVMWDWLRRAGADLDALAWLADHPTAPDLLGINHYLTSERYLDERLERYPPRWHGGNGVDCYADVEAVRVCEEGPLGLQALLREAWDRYHIPIAITEAHLDCTRDEQVRWLVEERAICEALLKDHVPIVALTVWSLLGSYDWNELVTATAGYYESGVFDVRSGQPRDTRLADVVRAWTAGRAFNHPVLDGQGWWRRPVRLLYPPVPRGDSAPVGHPLPPRRAVTRRRIVVVDGSASVRGEIERASHLRDIAVEFRTARELMSDLNMRGNTPGDGWAVLFAGLLDEVRGFEASDREVEQYRDLATAAAGAGYHLTFFSSQHVFALPRREPYLESDGPAPRTVRGQIAATLERSLGMLDASVLVVRPGLCFAERDHSGLTSVGQPSGEGVWWPVALPPATMCSLAYLPDLIRSVLDLVIDGERGIWHLANRGAVTAAQVREMLNGGMVSAHANGNEVLPYVLGSTRGPLLPDLADALVRGGYDAGLTSSIAPCSTSASL